MIEVGEAYILEGARFVVTKTAVTSGHQIVYMRFEDPKEFEQSNRWVFSVPASILVGKKAAYK